MPFDQQRAVWGARAQRFGQSAVGRALSIGAKESFGVYYEGSIFATEGLNNLGLFGWKGTATGRIFARDISRGGSGFGAASRFASRRMGKLGMAGSAKAIGKGALGFAGRALAPAFMGFTMYQGYQENGILGAARNAGEMVLIQSLIRGAGTFIGGSASTMVAGALLPVAAVAATAYGTYKVGEAAKRHVKGLRDLEFGGGQLMDAAQSAGATTMRQRSLSALQNTHLNGRMAMGNEAMMLHTPFR